MEMRERAEYLNCCSCLGEWVTTLKTRLTELDNCRSAAVAVCEREREREREGEGGKEEREGGREGGRERENIFSEHCL